MKYKEDNILNNKEYLNWIYNIENIDSNYDIEYNDNLSEDEIEKYIALSVLFKALYNSYNFFYEYNPIPYFPEENIYFSIKDKYFKLTTRHGQGNEEQLTLLTSTEERKKCLAIESL